MIYSVHNHRSEGVVILNTPQIERARPVNNFKLTAILVFSIALLGVSGNVALAQEDPEAGALKALCDDEGNSVACFKTGERYRILERDNNSALPYLLKGCDAGHMVACTHAGILTQITDKQYSPAWKKAAKLFQKACDAGEDPACFNLGSLKYREGRASAARKYFKMACDMKNAVACDNLKKLNE